MLMESVVIDGDEIVGIHPRMADPGSGQVRGVMFTI